MERKMEKGAKREYSPADINALEGTGWIKLHPIHVAITKDPRAALILAYGLNRAMRSTSSGRWWRATYKEFTAATGLTRHQIDAAREILDGLGVLRDKGGKIHREYRIDYESYVELMRAAKPAMEDHTEEDLTLAPRKVVKPQRIRIASDGTALIRINGVEVYVDLSVSAFQEAVL